MSLGKFLKSIMGAPSSSGESSVRIGASPKCRECGNVFSPPDVICKECGSAVGLGQASRALNDALASSEEQVAIAAAEAMAWYPDAETSRTGLDFLVSQTRNGDGRAVFELAKLPDDFAKSLAAEYAAARLLENAPKYRWTNALIQADLWTDTTVTVLLNALAADNPDVSRNALYVLAYCPDARAVAALRCAAASDDQDQSYWGNRSMLLFGGEEDRQRAFDHYVQSASVASDYLDVKFACESLADSSRREIRLVAIDLYIKLFGVVDPGEIQYMCESISKIPDTEAGSLLGQLVLSCEYGDALSGEIEMQIHNLSEPARASMCQTLSEHLDVYDMNNLLCAFKSWALCGDRSKVALVRQYVSHSDDAVAAEAREALARLGEVDCVDSICKELDEALSGKPKSLAVWQSHPDFANYSVEDIADLEAGSMVSVLRDVAVAEVAVQVVPFLAPALSHNREGTAKRAAWAIRDIARRARIPAS